MAKEILIIGVGSAGVIAADKMNIPNSKKLFVDTDFHELDKVKSEGYKLFIECKDRERCPFLYCHCYMRPEFCKKLAEDYEDEIRETIKRAFE